MSVYSIKDLEHLSGIKAHTIRIWEQRYNLFSPQRTATNIRFYDDDDLKLILNIASLKNHGFKITVRGFDLVFRTWWDTRIARARASRTGRWACEPATSEDPRE